MKRALFAAVLLFVPVVLIGQPVEIPRPTLVLTNARIFTAEGGQPFLGAIAIKDDKILAVVTQEELRRFVPPNVRPPFPVIDVRGRVVIPGFNDAHTHPGNATPAIRIAPGGDPSWSDISAAIAGMVDETPADMWIIAVVGASIINDQSITRVQLDQLAPNRKILIKSLTGHGMIMSSAAMRALDVRDEAPDPPGGFFGRDANERLNGRAFEYAQWRVERRFLDLATDDELLDDIRAFSEEALRFGITSIQAMPLMDQARFLTAWRRAGTPIRLRVMNFPFDTNAQPVTGANGIKWIFDGTPIERGAAVRTRYPNDGGTGRINFPDLVPLVKYAYTRDQQLLVHASGDDTVAKTFAAMQSVASDWPARRPRIEHGDGLQRDLFPRARQLGVIVVQNPSHFAARGAFPQGEYQLAKSILNAGIPFALASDGPLNPFLNILLATDRPDIPAEALTREQAFIAYTTTPAFAEFKEREKGKIAAGMLADLAVLSGNPFTARLSELPEIRSIMTIIGGEIVYRDLNQP